jgi:hypothetical protein
MAALCEGFAPGVSYGKRRIMAHAQKCGALPEPGLTKCPVHLKAAGWKRCDQCGAWMEPTSAASRVLHRCPNSCKQPDVLTGVVEAFGR